jgi:hypothetical protein
MSRQSREAGYTRAFGERLRQVVQQLDVPVLQVGRELGYRDGSTLHAAMAGRCVLDVERLAQLAHWCGRQGHLLDLHWLLTGHASASKRDLDAGWLTPKRQAALKTLAEAVSELPEPPRKRKRASSPEQGGRHA